MARQATGRKAAGNGAASESSATDCAMRGPFRLLRHSFPSSLLSGRPARGMARKTWEEKRLYCSCLSASLCAFCLRRRRLLPLYRDGVNMFFTRVSGIQACRATISAGSRRRRSETASSSCILCLDSGTATSRVNSVVAEMGGDASCSAYHAGAWRRCSHGVTRRA